jgi:threonine dehydrogenase-like Zn-dependent dehydrogenase
MKAYVLEAIWDPKPGYTPNQREVKDKRAIRSDMVYRDIKAGIKDAPVPEVGDNDILIKVGACGICGSDMHAGNMADDGYTKYAGQLRLPVIFGHEFSGEIVEIGKNVTGFMVGDLIAPEQIRPCGTCDACRTGYFNSCRNIEEVGLTMDGAFCEYTLVPANCCYNINNIADLLGDKVAAFEAAALAEPTGVAYNGIVVNGNGVTPGTHVAIFGTGPIGLAAVAIARASGAADIFAIDISDERLELAKACGASYTINSATLGKQNISVADVVLEQTKGLGCKMVVEAAGAPQVTYPEIVKLMSIDANVVALGRSPKFAPIDLEQFIVKGCRLSGSLGTSGNGIIPSVLKMIASNRIDMRKIITGRYPLIKTPEAILDARGGHHGKVMISQFYK